jgi:hypothetical protein
MKKNSNISDPNIRLESLLERLRKHSEWKYPERKWTKAWYEELLSQWKGKEQQLEERVLKFEDDMRECMVLCNRKV